MSEIIGHSDSQMNSDNPKCWFEWVGPESDPVAISMQYLEMMPNLPNELPWKLKEVHRDKYAKVVYFVRADL